MDFYEELQKRVEAEASDKDEYLELAKIAPTEKARKILKDIASEEKMHRRYLQELLEERPSSDCKSENKSGSNSRLDADNNISYPSHIENVGVDPDELMD
jgi:rubrerythrin